MRQSVIVCLSAAALAFSTPVLDGQGRGQNQGVPPLPNGECPPGHTLVRIGRCQAPEVAPPSIVDYRPKSTLVVDEHLVPKAKFPVVDIHSHQTATADNMPQLITEMDALNLRVLNNLSGGSGASLKEKVDAIRNSPYKDRFTVFANPDFRGVAPGWGAKAAAQLEQDVRNGAQGLKIFKNLGMEVRDASGKRVPTDDPRLDPVWRKAGELGIPVLIHTGDPAPFWQPHDAQNERWLELKEVP